MAETVAQSVTETHSSLSPKFPEVHVQLVGQDGNAFAIIGRISGAMCRAGIDKADIDAFQADAISGDYNHLLRVAMCTVSTS